MKVNDKGNGRSGGGKKGVELVTKGWLSPSVYLWCE